MFTKIASLSEAQRARLKVAAASMSLEGRASFVFEGLIISKADLYEHFPRKLVRAIMLDEVSSKAQPFDLLVEASRRDRDQGDPNVPNVPADDPRHPAIVKKLKKLKRTDPVLYTKILSWE